MDRKPYVVSFIIGLVLVALLLSAFREAYSQEVYEGVIQWNIIVKSLYTISIGGDASSFDMILVMVDARGTELKATVLSLEIADAQGRNEKGADRDAVFSVSAMSTTEITITCNVEAKFDASAEGKGNILAKFEDGLDAIFLQRQELVLLRRPEWSYVKEI